MKKIILLIFILSFPVQVQSKLALNCFEPQFGAARVTHKQYYGERWIEPYRWGNPFEKPVKEWYQDSIREQRNELRKKYERNGIIKFTMPDVPFW